MQQMVKALDKACERWGMHISVKKVTILAVGEQESDHSPISMQGQALQEFESFPQLGSEVGQTTGVDKEVTVRLKKSSTVYQNGNWDMGKECIASGMATQSTVFMCACVHVCTCVCGYM